MIRNISIIIQARIGSTRLPGKVLKSFNGKSVLWHVINRVSKSKYINNVIIATTTEEKDDIIYNYCNQNNIPVFRGSENDVLDRYYQCAKKYKMTDIVRITADCPLHDAAIIDKVIEKYLDENLGFDYVSNTFEYTYPDGMDVEVFSFKVLEEAWKNAALLSEREHVTPYIRKNPNYKKLNVFAEKKYPQYRLTLDCDEDFQLIERIYNGIGKDDFSLDDIVSFLDKNTYLPSLNMKYEINEGYMKSIEAENGV